MKEKTQNVGYELPRHAWEAHKGKTGSLSTCEKRERRDKFSRPVKRKKLMRASKNSRKIGTSLTEKKKIIPVQRIVLQECRGENPTKTFAKVGRREEERNTALRSSAGPRGRNQG